MAGIATGPTTSASAARRLARTEAPAELVADKGNHGRAVLKDLDGGPWRTRISEPSRRHLLRWRGDDRARRAVYNDRTRSLGDVARIAFKLRAELCDRGRLRRTWLRGRDNVAKRYLDHVAAHNVALPMRARTGFGTPKAAAEAARSAVIHLVSGGLADGIPSRTVTSRTEGTPWPGQSS